MLPGTRCKFCRVKFSPGEKGPLHPDCFGPYAESFASRLARRRVAKAKQEKKVEAKVTRERKKALKRIPDLLKEAQREFNGFIRARDANCACICCGLPLGGGGMLGGGFDCGHYRSVGSAPHLRFNEQNAHGQRKHCNRYGAGRAVNYRLGLIERIGIEAVEALEADNRTHKWTREELICIRETYKTKLKELRTSQ